MNFERSPFFIPWAPRKVRRARSVFFETLMFQRTASSILTHTYVDKHLYTYRRPQWLGSQTCRARRFRICGPSRFRCKSVTICPQMWAAQRSSERRGPGVFASSENLSPGKWRERMVAFTVNGVRRELGVDPDTPLLWILREHLKLTGTKFGCGIASCGACTVHIDGQAARACATPVSMVEGKSVTTIEGLSPDGSHPLQKPWIAEQLPQCGYCQSGPISQPT